MPHLFVSVSLITKCINLFYEYCLKKHFYGPKVLRNFGNFSYPTLLYSQQQDRRNRHCSFYRAHYYYQLRHLFTSQLAWAHAPPFINISLLPWCFAAKWVNYWFCKYVQDFPVCPNAIVTVALSRMRLRSSDMKKLQLKTVATMWNASQFKM